MSEGTTSSNEEGEYESTDLCRDDGLAMGDVGDWATDKHEKVGYYASIFATAMKGAMDCRVYIDLFAGSGKARIRNTDQIVPGSPLVALSLDDPFDKYIFCEFERANTDALTSRVAEYFPDRDVSIFNIDSNERISWVVGAVPRFSKTFKGLTLCFVDPFKAKNLKFETLRKMASEIRVDFIVLLPTAMDINRNERHYTRPEDPTLDEFLGTDSWRESWAKGESRFKDFGLFIADQFGKQMATMEYHYDDTDELVAVRRGEERGIYLYHLGFFSKSPLGVKFWRETLKRTSRQLPLELF